MMKCNFCGKDTGYLPFKCKFCGEHFCSEHRLPEDHDCQHLHSYKEKSKENWKKGVQEGIAEKRRKESFIGRIIEKIKKFFGMK